MNIRRMLALVSVCCALTALAGAWTEDLDQARKSSKEKNLPIMLDFTGSDWCYWCKLMDRQVFAEKAWDAWAATNVVCVTVNFPRDESSVPEKTRKQNEELMKKYGVRGFPTFVLLAPGGGKELGRAHCPGRDVTPEKFISEVQKALGKAAAK